MNIVVITQARLGSTRLPNKVLKTIGGKSLLEIHVNRIQKAKTITKIIVATTDKPQDDHIESSMKKLGISVFRGSENDVLDRFYQTVKDIKPQLIVRLTSDCPLIDPELIDLIVIKTIENSVDYCSNTLLETFPDGQDIEVFTFKALEKAWEMAKLQSEREHVTPFIKNNSSFYGKNKYTALNIPSDNEIYKDVRMTVDELEDFSMIKLLINKLGVSATWKNYADLYMNNENINSLNKNIIRNEGYLKSIKKDI